MIRRRVYIGEPALPLSESYPTAVFFVGRKVPTSLGLMEDELVGTSFVVMISVPAVSAYHLYVVTAAHVVESLTHSFVRVPVEGGVRDMDVPKWFTNGMHDVAVAPIVLPEDNAVLGVTSLDSFVDDEAWEEDTEFYKGMHIQLGDVVYFIGLLGKINAMAEQNIPVVRSGTIARLGQERVPIQMPDGSLHYITAHLIDCRSFSGFSGSPCYVQWQRAGVLWNPETGQQGIGTKERTALLGLVAGHFDDLTNVRSAGKANPHLESPVNTGIGYVIPAEYIRETLMQEELVQMRKDAERELAERPEVGATQDSAQEEGSEFERFENLARTLVNTPKPAPEEDSKAG